MSIPTQFEASIKRGTADRCPDHLIPDELKRAKALWQSQGAEAQSEIGEHEGAGMGLADA